ncbi:DNA adenine methylase [Lysinibacillus sphaericus]|uniref:DNA adenine methylase n=1 Tax=Lysinibacillus sphaericus TaxID=1421 RepID=UPI00211EC64A|nr:DNA adenine methylase [Lysinibacillus sphaericus]
MANPSPLRYPGGKYKIFPFVRELIKVNKCSTYIEPFTGGSAVSLALLLEGTVKKIIINDYDYSIYCFWYSVLNHTEEFINLIKKTNIDLDEWYKQKEVRNDINNKTKLEIGFSTFFLNRTNRSGIIDKAGPIGGKNQEGNYLLDCRFNKTRLIEKINEIAKYRNFIYLYNLDAMDFIEEVVLKTRNSFTFFDPPYYNKGQGLYTNFYNHGDHANLAQLVYEKMRNRKWIVTYDNSSEIESMYSNFDKLKFSLSYTLQEKKNGEEILFFSSSVKRLEDEDKLLKILK